jgi:integrase
LPPNKVEQYYRAALDNTLRRIGPSKAVERFLSKYGNVRTQAIYASQLWLYWQYLLGEGLTPRGATEPGALITDNLVCVFESKATDVDAKRKHTDFLGDYVNKHLLQERGCSESKRRLAAAAIKEFYKKNDSPLWGDFTIASQPLKAPVKALYAEDIRRVLLALPVRTRTPLLISWQSGIEINRVLSMTFPVDQVPPVSVPLFGRKGHRKSYSSFIGTDAVNHLRMTDGQGFVLYHTVLYGLRDAAKALGEKGLLRNSNPESWHPHALRHSFETEASHAGVKAEFRDYFLGHVGGIQWVYNHRDEIHPEDLVAEWSRIEPYVSLNPDQAVVRRESSERERSILNEYLLLRKDFEALKAEFLASRGGGPFQRTGAQS